MKIAGPGRLRVGPEGLMIEAFQADARTKIEAALVLVCFIIVALFLQFTDLRYFADLPSISLPILGGAFGGLLYFAVIGGRDKHVREKRVQLVIPWASVGGATKGLRHPGSVVVEVRGDDGPAALYFDPAAEPSEVLRALQRRPAA